MQMIFGLIPDQGKRFVRDVKTDCGAHTASYSNGTGVYILCNQRGPEREADHAILSAVDLNKTGNIRIRQN
jgi:hypothetical protein